MGTASHAQAEANSVRVVEQALSGLHATQTQEAIAESIGLASHGQVSRKMTRVLTGDDAYIEVYTLRQILRMAAAFPEIRTALQAALHTAAPPDQTRCLSTLMAQAGRVVSGIADATADGAVTPAERRQLDTLLAALATACEQARRALAGGT